MANQFLEAVSKYDTYTANGAISHSSSGSNLLDYFSKCGTYQNRQTEDVFATMGSLWAESPIATLQLVFYNRLISRKLKGFVGTESLQRGQGNRSEFRQCLVWLAKYQSEALAKNLWLVPAVGTWKDLWHDNLIEELDRKQVFALISRGMEDEYNRELIAKYLPRIRSKSQTHNNRHRRRNKFAHGLIKFLNWNPKAYRKFKSSGKAHVFQRQMCAGQWSDIDFNTIPGKALFSLVNRFGKDNQTAFQRHNIEDQYIDWIRQQPTAKFTGYVYELMNAVNPQMSLAQKFTLDKQFEGLIQAARSNRQGLTENVWCALDTSGSMLSRVANTSAFNICISLGLYFSTLNEGAFKDNVIMFDKTSKILPLSGSFSDKALQVLSANTAWGNTNFQSVIDEIVRVRTQNPNVPVEDFPTTLIVVSDMQFDPVNSNAQTNYEAAISKLANVGLPKIRIVWWWVNGTGTDFPNKLDDDGTIMIGGFDGSIIPLLIGGENQTVSSGPLPCGGTGNTSKHNPFDSMLKALNQEILCKVQH